MEYKKQKMKRDSLAMFVFVFLVIPFILSLGQRKASAPLAGLSSISSPEVKAQEQPITWNDAIRSYFPADEAGRMIRICMKENRKQDKTAINFNKNGTYDYSYCQVNSVHKPEIYNDTEWKALLEDPMQNAKIVRQIFLNEGWNSWSVFKFGLTK